jgi:hypothetical protein
MIMVVFGTHLIESNRFRLENNFGVSLNFFFKSSFYYFKSINEFIEVCWMFLKCFQVKNWLKMN